MQLRFDDFVVSIIDSSGFARTGIDLDVLERHDLTVETLAESFPQQVSRSSCFVCNPDSAHKYGHLFSGHSRAPLTEALSPEVSICSSGPNVTSQAGTDLSLLARSEHIPSAARTSNARLVFDRPPWLIPERPSTLFNLPLIQTLTLDTKQPRQPFIYPVESINFARLGCDLSEAIEVLSRSMDARGFRVVHPPNAVQLIDAGRDVHVAVYEIETKRMNTIPMRDLSPSGTRSGYRIVAYFARYPDIRALPDDEITTVYTRPSAATSVSSGNHVLTNVSEPPPIHMQVRRSFSAESSLRLGESFESGIATIPWEEDIPLPSRETSLLPHTPGESMRAWLKRQPPVPQHIEEIDSPSLSNLLLPRLTPSRFACGFASNIALITCSALLVAGYERILHRPARDGERIAISSIPIIGATLFAFIRGVSATSLFVHVPLGFISLIPISTGVTSSETMLGIDHLSRAGRTGEFIITSALAAILPYITISESSAAGLGLALPSIGLGVFSGIIAGFTLAGTVAATYYIADPMIGSLINYTVGYFSNNNEDILNSWLANDGTLTDLIALTALYIRSKINLP